MAVRAFDPGAIYTVKEAADRLNVSEKTVRRLIVAQTLGHFKVGGIVRVTEAHIVDLVRRQSV